MKTVYLFGSGCSKSLFDLPTMSEFFIDFNYLSYPYLNHFIKKYFNIKQDSDYQLLNLEDIITSLELRSDQFGSFGQEDDGFIIEAKKDFKRFINIKLSVPSVSHQLNIENLKKFGLDLHIVVNDENSKDSIITLNYDLGLDQLLFKESDKQDNGDIKSDTILDRMYKLLGAVRLYGGDRPSTYWKHRNLGNYFKIHGSLDWLYCPNENCINHQQFFPNKFHYQSKANDHMGIRAFFAVHLYCQY